MSQTADKKDEQPSSTNLTSLLAKISDFFGKTAPKIEELQRSLATTAAALEKATVELSAATQKITDLEASVAKLTKERDDALATAKQAKDDMARVEQEVDKRANIIAGQKLSQVGATPAKEKLSDDPRQTASATLEEQLQAETDPKKRDSLWAQIKEKWAKR